MLQAPRDAMERVAGKSSRPWGCQNAAARASFIRCSWDIQQVFQYPSDASLVSPKTCYSTQRLLGDPGLALQGWVPAWGCNSAPKARKNPIRANSPARAGGIAWGGRGFHAQGEVLLTLKKFWFSKAIPGSDAVDVQDVCFCLHY